ESALTEVRAGLISFRSCFALHEEAQVVVQTPVVEGVCFDEVGVAARAFDGHGSVVGIGDLQSAATGAALSVLRFHLHRGLLEGTGLSDEGRLPKEVMGRKRRPPRM